MIKLYNEELHEVGDVETDLEIGKQILVDKVPHLRYVMSVFPLFGGETPLAMIGIVDSREIDVFDAYCNMVKSTERLGWCIAKVGPD